MCAAYNVEDCAGGIRGGLILCGITDKAFIIGK
jgi:hypothetical protein